MFSRCKGINIYCTEQIFFSINALFCTETVTLCNKPVHYYKDMKRNLAVFASGSGTNAENLIRFFQAEQADVQVSVVVCNRQNAMVLQRIRPLGVPGVYIPTSEWTDGGAVLQVLRQYEVDWIVLAGFLLRVPEATLNSYPRRVINIHPSLLPLHGGKGMYGRHVHEAVLRDGDAESGITIHYVDGQFDCGQRIAQFRCPVLPGDTPDTLAQRVHRLEYEHYPREVLRLVRQG